MNEERLYFYSKKLVTLPQSVSPILNLPFFKHLKQKLYEKFGRTNY